MKSLAHEATGKPRPKRSTQNTPAKYWGTWQLGGAKRYAKKPDGTTATGCDKTAGFHSMKQKKEEIRAANRSINKSARQELKRQMNAEAEP